MKFSILSLLIVVTSLTSCKKEETFDHNSPEILYPCSCCDLADTVVGQYTGHFIKYDNSNWTPSNPVPGTVILDTLVTVNVTRNFSSTDFVMDSLVCWFDIPYFFNEPITLLENGESIDQYRYETQRFKHNYVDSAFALLLVDYEYPLPPSPNAPNIGLVSLYFKGIRQ